MLFQECKKVTFVEKDINSYKILKKIGDNLLALIKLKIINRKNILFFKILKN